MKKVKITAMRRSVYSDLIEKYENPIEHACDVEIGKEFVSVNGEKPDGLCSAAWESIKNFVSVLAHGGGNFYDGWMKNEKSAMVSCNDGFRPVSFLVEAIEPPCELEQKLEQIREKSARGEEIKILFVGDSLTYYNDMPMIFEALARSAHKNVRADSITKGGHGIYRMQTLPDFWEKVIAKIRSQDWDIVVYQPSRNFPIMTEFFPDYPGKELRAARREVEIIKEIGALPLQYSTFGVNKGSVTRKECTKVMTRREHTDLVTAFNAAVAEKLGERAVYVGEVFNQAIEKYPEINFYHTDEVHPSYAGSYAIASAFYTVIFGETAKDVEYTGELDAETAEKLRDAASVLLSFEPAHKAVIDETIEK